MCIGLSFNKMEMRCYDGIKYEFLYIMCFSNAVMEFRAGLEIGWVDPVSFAETFLAGRAKSMFPTYDLAFRKL